MPYSRQKKLFTYKYCGTIHVEAHQFIIDYGDAMVEIQKVRKFMDVINFGPVDAGKAVFLSHP